MLHISSLEVGRVYYWNSGGWHGKVKVTKISKNRVYYVDIENKCSVKETSCAKSKFIAHHSISENSL